MSKLKQGAPIRYNENSLFSKLQMRILKKKALKQSEATGRTTYVIPFSPVHVAIVDNVWRKDYNKKSKTNKLSYKRLIEIAYFATPKGERVIT